MKQDKCRFNHGLIPPFNCHLHYYFKVTSVAIGV